jgi:hypothetical protein
MKVLFGIRAAEFTASDLGDGPMLPELLDRIPPDQEIASVTARGAFDTHKCHDAIAARGAAAIIPPRKNAKPWKPDPAGAIARNVILRPSRRAGRTIWRRWSGYHRRSRAETTMHGVKLLGQRRCSRDFDRQAGEFQVRVALPNGFTALGIPVTEAVGWVCLGKGELRPSADLCNRGRPSRIAPENKGKIRPQPDPENAFAGASGGGNATAVEPSLEFARVDTFFDHLRSDIAKRGQ